MLVTYVKLNLFFMRKIMFLLFLLFCSTFIFGQTNDYYYLEFKEGNVPDSVTMIRNADRSILVSMNNQALADSLNRRVVYEFSHIFKTLNHPYLNKIYFLELQSGTEVDFLNNFSEINQVITIDKNVQFAYESIDEFSFEVLPNDYE